MTEPESDNPADPPRLGASIRSALTHALGLIHTRLSLALIELAEARDAFLAVFILAIAAMVMCTLALIAVSALIIVLAWDALGWRVILLLAVIYAGCSWLLWRTARGLIREGRLGLPQTLGELRQDRDALFPRDTP